MNRCPTATKCPRWVKTGKAEELLDSWNLLAVEYTAARLINHTVSETTKVLDLLARLRDRQIGDHTFAARFTGLPERCSCACKSLLASPIANSPGRTFGDRIII